MKKSKFNLVFSLIIILALIMPFTSFATNVEENTTTAETTDEPVVTSETPTDDQNETTTNDETDESTTENTEDENTEEQGDEGTESEEATLEEVKGNYFESNTNLVFNKAVDGNAFLTGDKVTLQGQINGDLVVIANDLIIEESAKIFGNLFVICDNLTHSGLVYNLYAITTNYDCKYEGLAALDVKVFADNISFSGYAERSLYFISDNIELTDDAYILGNLVYSSNNDPIIGENATIYGEKIAQNIQSFLPIKTENTVLNYILTVLSIIGLVLLVILVITIFKPNTFNKEIKFNFITCLKALGLGLLSVIVIPIISILLLISTIFSIFGVILLGAFILVLLLSATVSILTLATILYNKFSKNKSRLFLILYAILISLVYYGLIILPYVGIILSLLINITGLGLIILWLLTIRKNNKLVNDNTKKEKTNKTDKLEKKEDKRNAKNKDEKSKLNDNNNDKESKNE